MENDSHVVIVTDPGTQQQFAVQTKHIVSVHPASAEMYVTGARTVIQSDLVQTPPNTSAQLATSWVCSEPWSKVMRMAFAYEASADQLKREQELEEAARLTATRLAIPDTATVRNFTRRG